MLPDLRQFLILGQLNETRVNASDILRGAWVRYQHGTYTLEDEVELLALVLDILIEENPRFSEYGLMMHFAWFTPKWHDKYSWHLVPNGRQGQLMEPIRAFTIHQTFAKDQANHPSRHPSCPVNRSSPSDQLEISVYPANYGVYWDGHYIRKSKRSAWGASFRNRTVTDIAKLQKYYGQGTASLVLAHEQHVSSMRQAGLDLNFVGRHPDLVRSWGRCLLWRLAKNASKSPNRSSVTHGVNSDSA